MDSTTPTRSPARRRQSGFLSVLCLVCAWSAPGGVAAAEETKPFKVCADPENMPFSNRQLQGFENKIASVIAKELGASPSYVWWGQRRGFIRNTMNATLKEARCEIVIGVPEGYDLVRTTKPGRS
jgi:mxaJ protein